MSLSAPGRAQRAHQRPRRRLQPLSFDRRSTDAGSIAATSCDWIFHLRLHREILAVLTREIVAAQPPVGELLEREADLAARFDVSRGVTRECIRALEERGLVRVRHGHGAIVNPRAQWNVLDQDVVAAVLESPLAPDLLSALLECRRILEVETAALAAERANDQGVAQIEAALEAMKQVSEHPGSQEAEARFHEVDLRFHEAIVEATGNPVLGSVARRIHDAQLAARYPLARPQYRIERALPEHTAIHDAIAARDAGAARAAMAAHLSTIERYLREHASRVATPA